MRSSRKRDQIQQRFTDAVSSLEKMNEETGRILQNGLYKRERMKKHDISANLQRSDLADSLPHVTFKPSGSILNAVEGLAEGMRQLATSGELAFHGNPAAENLAPPPGRLRYAFLALNYPW